MIANERGELIELGNSSYSLLLHSPSRSVRKKAFHQYYKQFVAHENTLAATLSGSIAARRVLRPVRQRSPRLEASLFHDKVPRAVVDSLIASVRRALAGR